MAIESGIDALKTATDGIQNKLDLLDGAFALLLTEWTGEAADAFSATKMDWFSSMGEARTVLVKITWTLTEVLRRYEETEQAVIQACG